MMTLVGYNVLKRMENSKNYNLETRRAINKVKQLTDNENLLASIQALLNFIPYAGGTLSLVLSEYRGRRNAKRIFGVLDELHEAIEGLSEEPQRILTPDQVVEVVHNTLEEIAKTSSEEKFGYLRNALVKAFTAEEITYSQKQFYLATLKDMPLGELELMREIYISPDPFIQTLPQRGVSGVSNGLDNLRYVGRLNVFQLPPQYDIEYKEPDSGETLRDVLEHRLSHLSEGALEGLIDSLDAKGLSRIRPHLEKRTVKIMTEVYRDLSRIAFPVADRYVVPLQVEEPTPRETPIEASRTHFGEDFIRYIQSKY